MVQGESTLNEKKNIWVGGPRRISKKETTLRLSSLMCTPASSFFHGHCDCCCLFDFAWVPLDNQSKEEQKLVCTSHAFDVARSSCSSLLCHSLSPSFSVRYYILAIGGEVGNHFSRESKFVVKNKLEFLPNPNALHYSRHDTETIHDFAFF